MDAFYMDPSVLLVRSADSSEVEVSLRALALIRARTLFAIEIRERNSV